jgi:hypothetical protein
VKLAGDTSESAMGNRTAEEEKDNKQKQVVWTEKSFLGVVSFSYQNERTG